jgi:hypothetical protein
MFGLLVVRLYVSRSRRYRKPPSRSTRHGPPERSAQLAFSSAPRRLLLRVSVALPLKLRAWEMLVPLSKPLTTSKNGRMRSVDPGWPDDATLRLVERGGT